MTPRRLARAVGTATLGTALLAGSFVLMARTEAPTGAMVAWAAAALVAVFAYLARYRPDTLVEALRQGALVAVAQTVVLHGLLWAFDPRAGLSPVLLMVRHLLAFGVLDVVTLTAAALVGRWFPHGPPGARP
jgi:hypothetical protein